jgi:HEPN superfamily AbiU2-like protein
MIIGRLNNPDPRIPAELRDIYEHLAGGLMDTLGVLDELTVLFSTSKEAVALMNQTAATFFVRHEQLLIHHIVLSVARFTDPERSGHRSNPQDNLVLSRLLNLKPEQKRLRNDLAARLKVIRTLAEPMRRYRHKLLAHASMAEYLAPATNIGGDITLGSMRDVLTKIGEYISTFEEFFTGNDATFYYPRSYGEAADLLEYLRLGLDAEKKQNENRLKDAMALGKSH